MSCRCTDCAFLMLNKRNSIERETVGRDYRENGTIPSSGGYYVYDVKPACHKGLEIGPFDQPDNLKACYDVVKQDRTCQSFVLWKPGLSAKEHDDMITRAEMDARELKLKQEMHQETLLVAKQNSIRSALIAAGVSLTVALIHALIAWLTHK